MAEKNIEASEVQPVETAKLLDALPGLVGAIDTAIVDRSGKKFPFVLLVFGNDAAMHATNMDAKVAMACVQQFAAATKGD